jgi:molecular chaperone GrpE
VEEFVKFANESLILEIIDSLDDLYEIAKNTNNTNGIGQAIKNFEKILAKYGVEKIKVEGEKFDPMFHEAMETEKDGTNLQEIRTGWTMHGKVIRPARVKIMK